MVPLTFFCRIGRYNGLLTGFREATELIVVDIQNYMQTIGQQAREASRAIARADSNSKNLALRTIANAILDRDELTDLHGPADSIIELIYG